MNNFVLKRKNKFEDFKHCLEATQKQIFSEKIISMLIIFEKIINNSQKTINHFKGHKKDLETKNMICSLKR